MSNICVLKGNVAEGEEWLEQVLDEFPDDAGALNDLGYLWADEGQHLQRALRMVQAAVNAEPDSPAYRDSLGWALHRVGREAEAAVELRKAVKDQPDGEILEHLAEVYAKQQQLDEARQAYRRAVDVYQKEKETDKAKAVLKKLELLKQ
jgi:Flp pilus assembly protein TadD